jgi:DNA-binding IclR family transcriptional regulator
MLAEAREPLSLATITTQMRLPKSTVHGLCTTLVHAGLLTRFENGTYHLGLHVMDLAHAFLERTDLTIEFVKIWESLALSPDQTIILAVLDGADVVYVACRNGTAPLGFNFRIGMRLPANCTASGKAMLASLPPERVKELMTVAGLRRLTKKKTGGMNGLLKQLALVRKHGFSMDDEETCEGMLCFGAPVFDSRSGEAVAGVAVSMPKAPVLPRRCEIAVKAVKQMADALSKRLGARPSSMA